MKEWRTLAFEEAVDDVSAGNAKTPQTEFLANGRYPVVDQGQALIAGYIDDSSRLCKADLPAIVFGDHTRYFKFVDFPFCIGADGVRVLRPRDGIDAKYLLHYFSQLALTDGGYDRHFKYLKRSSVLCPPLDVQRRIADILDRADALRAQRRATLTLLDTLTQSIFVDMFGDVSGATATASVGDVADVQGGLQVSHARAPLPVEVPYLRVANVSRGELLLDVIKTMRVTPAELERTALRADDLLVVEGHGNPDELGRCALWRAAFSPCVHQNHLIRVRPRRTRVEPRYLHDFLNSPVGRRHLIRAGNTTSGLNTISVADVRATPLILPAMPRQVEYAHRMAAVDKLKAAHRASLAQLDSLFASLQHRAFRGEL